MNWKELSPEMSYLTETMDMYMYIFIIIILLALLFGIINTMLMVVMERRKEIGMLMAIGMQKFKIFRMIVVESILLSLVGGIVGIIIGAGVARIGQTIQSIFPCGPKDMKPSDMMHMFTYTWNQHYLLMLQLWL